MIIMKKATIRGQIIVLTLLLSIPTLANKMTIAPYGQVTRNVYKMEKLNQAFDEFNLSMLWLQFDLGYQGFATKYSTLDPLDSSTSFEGGISLPLAPNYSLKIGLQQHNSERNYKLSVSAFMSPTHFVTGSVKVSATGGVAKFIIGPPDALNVYFGGGYYQASSKVEHNGLYPEELDELPKIPEGNGSTFGLEAGAEFKKTLSKNIILTGTLGYASLKVPIEDDNNEWELDFSGLRASAGIKLLF